MAGPRRESLALGGLLGASLALNAWSLLGGSGSERVAPQPADPGVRERPALQRSGAVEAPPPPPPPSRAAPARPALPAAEASPPAGRGEGEVGPAAEAPPPAGLAESAVLEIPVDRLVGVLAERLPDTDSIPNLGSVDFLVDLLGGPGRVGPLLEQAAAQVARAEGKRRTALIDLIQRLQRLREVPPASQARANAELIRALDGAEESHLQASLLRALAPLPGSQAALHGATARLLRSPQPWVRTATIELFARLELPQAAADLVQIARDEQETVANRVLALRSVDLTQLSAQQLVLDLAQHADAELRAACFARLDRVDPARALPVLHAALWREPSDYARRQLFAALQAHGSRESVSALRTYLAGRPDDAARAEAALTAIERAQQAR